MLYQEYIEHKAERYKSQIEKETEAKLNFEKKLLRESEKKEKLKEKLRELEEEELDYLSRLKKTVINKQKEFEEFKTNSLSTSRLVTTDEIKNYNKSMPPQVRSGDK